MRCQPGHGTRGMSLRKEDGRSPCRNVFFISSIRRVLAGDVEPNTPHLELAEQRREVENGAPRPRRRR